MNPQFTSKGKKEDNGLSVIMSCASNCDHVCMKKEDNGLSVIRLCTKLSSFAASTAQV